MKQLIRGLLVLLTLVSSTVGIVSAQTTSNPFQQRRIALTLLNLDGGRTTDYGLGWMRTMRAAGCNTVIIPISWDNIYKNKGAQPNWQLIDNQMKLADELGMMIGIRIHVNKNLNNIGGYWEKKDCQLDPTANVLTHGYNETMGSFSSEQAIKSISEFVTEVCKRYQPYQTAGKVLFVNISYTPDQEAGYYYRNRQWPNDDYPTTFDHSDPSMDNMRERLKQKYTTVNTLNQYWGTKFIEWKKVDPPSNIWVPKANFLGKEGKDWYSVRHFQLKEFHDRLHQVIKSVDNSYKICLDVGSFTDSQSILRGTLGVTSLTENVDYVKHNDEETDWSSDIVRNNIKNKPLFNEIYHFAQYTVDDLVRVMNWYFEEGSSMVCIIVANDERDVPMAKSAVERIVNLGWYNRPIVPIQSQAKMDLYLSQLIDDYQGRFDRWNQLTEKRTKRVQINLIEDIFQPEKITPLPYKTPEQLSIEYGYYTPPSGGGGGNTNTNPGGGIPKDTSTNNKKPYSQRRYTPKPIIVKQPFMFYFENNVFVDEDGYIAMIEIVEGPKWLTFRRDGFFFQGTAPSVGKYQVKLRAYDNKGATAEDTFTLEVVPPEITFNIVKADYFDVPFTFYGPLVDGWKYSVDQFPEKINVIAECNVDSIEMHMNLTGAFEQQYVDDRKWFSLFREGQGFNPPMGVYELEAVAMKKDSVITRKKVMFEITNERDAPPMEPWVSYPNPFGDVTNLTVPKDINLSEFEYTLATTDGKRYPLASFATTVRPQGINFNLRKMGLAAGVYFIEIWRKGELIQRNKVVRL